MSDELKAVHVSADVLRTALQPCAKAPRRNAVVELAFDPSAGRLTVAEAKHGHFANDVTATGEGALGIQVDGPRLHALASRFPSDTVLALALEGDALVIRHGRSTTRLPGRTLAKRTFTPPRGHTGPVSAKTDSRMEAAPKGDTWAFSAQVPFADPPRR